LIISVIYVETPSDIIQSINKVYPMPLTATGQYDVEVGRLRKNIAFDNALEFFVCGDQLLRGAALNAVAVAEAMVENGALKAKVAA
jgi:aspartate-semialdehyde dehydrogenase